MEKIRQCVGKYKNIVVYKYQNMRTNLMKGVKDSWSKDSKFLMGKNKVVQVALGKTTDDEIKEGLSLVSACLAGERGLLFTDRPVKEAVKELKAVSQDEFAQAGQVASQSFILEKGMDIDMSGAIEPYLRKLGLNTSLVNTQIVLNANFVLSQEGKPLNPEQCKLLKLFGKKLAKFTILPVATWTSNGQFLELKQ